jgi:hypothetical protein
MKVQNLQYAFELPGDLISSVVGMRDCISNKLPGIAQADDLLPHIVPTLHRSHLKVSPTNQQQELAKNANS